MVLRFTALNLSIWSEKYNCCAVFLNNQIASLYFVYNISII
ncbi:hypothetical protein CPT_Morttis_251 [Acinetobacter phage Morttis]|nr:hypothetical protein CPT_Maestro_257 [Acinetobacter phage Maestro]QQM18737.1 hypothetical protein CPT_Morttis_251 [Acinetobacter phage Morttis]